MLRNRMTSERQAALDYLYGRIDLERSQATDAAWRTVNLDRMRQLLERLDSPQSSLKIVHVAGTKGKGSVATMIATVLTAAGYRTGLFTSPHLERIEERFVIDGSPATPAELCALVQRIQPAVSAMDAQAIDAAAQGPTYFEITTALALLHFHFAGAEAAVLEVGLGGRLDATNVCQPEVSVITNISLDHTKLLGNTTAAIAREKAGIIKPGVPVVSGIADDAAARVVREIAHERHCQLIERGREYSVTARTIGHGRDATPSYLLDFRCRVSERETRREGLPLPLLGDHQAENAATSLATLCVLAERGWRINRHAIRCGLQNVKLPARLEVVATEPLVIVDSAHNVASIAASSQTLLKACEAAHRYLVLALAEDKDARGIVEAALPAFDEVVVTQFQHNPRALPANELGEIVARTIEQQGQAAVKNCLVVPQPAEAWRTVYDRATSKDLICITGSFFLAAQLRGLVRETVRTRPIHSPVGSLDENRTI